MSRDQQLAEAAEISWRIYTATKQSSPRRDLTISLTPFLQARIDEIISGNNRQGLLAR